MNSHTRRSFIRGGALAAALGRTAAPSADGATKPPAAGKQPARIVLTWTGDPARSQAVTWRTELPADSPQAQIAPLTPNPKFQDSAVTVQAASEAVALPEGRNATMYSARFESLKPGSQYAYRVGDGTTWSEWNICRTADEGKDGPFRFLYVGDAQNEIHSLWSRAIRAGHRAAPDARFVIHAGDLVDVGYEDRLWGEWCDSLSFISAMLPSLPVPGNHDLHRAPGSADNGGPLIVPATWHQHFALPGNGPEVLRGQSYCLDYQGVRFIALDVNVFAGKIEGDSARQKMADQQLAWLSKVLSENRSRWTVVFQHQPVYPISKERKRAVQMESLLVPLYDKHHVDVVLQGHDHAYGRTHKLRNGKIVAGEEPGTIYTTTVSGPKMYKLTPVVPDLMAKLLEGVQLYQVIDVQPHQLRYQAYTIDGAVVDAFELHKDKQG